MNTPPPHKPQPPSCTKHTHQTLKHHWTNLQTRLGLNHNNPTG